MDRKEFIMKTSAGILVGIPVASLIGCSSSDDDSVPQNDDNPDPDPDPDPMANCLQNGTDSTITANHGHSLTVSKEDVAAGTEKTYTLSQASTDQHVHEVTLTAANFTALKGNSDITVTSTSSSGHTHSVTVSCA